MRAKSTGCARNSWTRSRSDESQLSAISPQGKLGPLRAPVFLLHGATDDIIPSTETLWLEKDIPKAYLREALITPAFSHVDPDKHAVWMRSVALGRVPGRSFAHSGLTSPSETNAEFLHRISLNCRCSGKLPAPKTCGLYKTIRAHALRFCRASRPVLFGTEWARFSFNAQGAARTAPPQSSTFPRGPKQVRNPWQSTDQPMRVQFHIIRLAAIALRQFILRKLLPSAQDFRTLRRSKSSRRAAPRPERPCRPDSQHPESGRHPAAGHSHRSAAPRGARPARD